jgi:hypothetical protein
MNKFLNYIDYTLATLFSYPVVIQIAIFFIIINSVLGIVFYFGMLVTRNLRKAKEDNYSRNEVEMRDFIKSTIFNESLLESEVIRSNYHERFEKLDKKTLICLFRFLN